MHSSIHIVEGGRALEIGLVLVFVLVLFIA